MGKNIHEVIVVGSGAGGGMVAHNLTQAGVNVVMLEAGRKYNPRTETNMFGLPSQSPLRGERTPDKQGGFYDATIGGGEIPGEPYTKGDGNGQYWWRARMLGGRTNHWGRKTPRYGPDDFKTYTNTGREIDWPISYEDIAPYYDRVDALIGVFGANETEAQHNAPVTPNHIRQSPPEPKITELVFAKACGELGIKTRAAETAILTKPLGDRAACFYATDCSRGCSTGAGFDSVLGFINPALKTGRLDIIADAMVSKVLMDKQNKKAIGVRYIDKTTGDSKDIFARVIILAASTMATSRILLNSNNKKSPRGLANSSGLVGKYLADTSGAFLILQIPALENLPAQNEDGVYEHHLYAPWWLHGKSKEKAGADFSGGYQTTIKNHRSGLPTMGKLATISSLKKGLYGKRLKQHMRYYYGTTAILYCLGAVSLNENCKLTIDPKVKDQWGIPVPKVDWTSSHEDYQRLLHMYESLHKIAQQMGAIVISDPSVALKQAGKITDPVGAVHETGGCRMGANPKTSVLNPWSQSWDVPNLYVADGAPFVTHPEKNPTLTIMALALRASDNIIKRLKENSL
ncbi:GMC family oxidoreductase [Porticoccaceae bacterium]|nr:GMC family oxidoreductase [Porticoccaceae bacterium]